MSGGGFVFVINIAMGVLLLAAFAGAWIYDRRRQDAMWILVAFLCALISAGFEVYVNVLDDAWWAPRFALFALHLIALMFYAAGVLRHYGLSVPWRGFGALYILSLAANFQIVDWPRESILWLTIYETSYFLMALSAPLFGGHPRRSLLDAALFLSMILFALQYAIRPALALAAGGIGATPSDYLGTTYGLITQMLMTVTTMATAGILVALIMRDIVRGLVASSRTDPLSGLLSRSGFETAAAAAIANADDAGRDIAIAVADLDHFKVINDTRGHAAGDRAITWFGSMVNDRLDADSLAGRLGGEEFAVLFAGIGSDEAGRWCEVLRKAMARSGAVGDHSVPAVTASFGVTRRRPGETLEDLLRRADEALYHAKRAGRDRVVVRDLQRYVLPSPRRPSVPPKPA